MTAYGVVQDRYELEEIVGSGGMGVVYRGRDRVLGRTVAVKMIRREIAGEEFVRRFEREAAILARLRSPHILVVYDYGRHERDFYMVTDFLPGGDLLGLLEDGPLPVPEALRIAALVAEGLADAHDAGVIHRDIKPANILLWSRGGELQPVLADFGIAVTEDLSLTATGAVIGSPLFMAPERHVGEPATVASDIYAMGVMLFTLVTGRTPFTGNGFQAASAHLHEPVPPVPDDLPDAAALDDLIGECMAKDPADRIASASLLAERIRAIGAMPEPASAEVVMPRLDLNEGSGTVVRGSAAGDAHARRRRAPVVAAVLAVLLIGAGVGGGMWWTGRDDAGDSDDQRTETGLAGDGAASTPPSSGPAPPNAPGLVEYDVARLDRAVRLEVALPEPEEGTQVVLQRRQGSWQRETGTRLTIPTPVGGEDGCATLRLVAISAGGSVAGPPTEACGRSLPPGIDVVWNPAECVEEGIACHYYTLTLHGFPSDEDLTLEAYTDETREADPDVLELTTRPDGTYIVGSVQRGTEYKPGGYHAAATASTLYLAIDGYRTWAFDLARIREDGA